MTDTVCEEENEGYVPGFVECAWDVAKREVVGCFFFTALTAIDAAAITRHGAPRDAFSFVGLALCVSGVAGYGTLLAKKIKQVRRFLRNAPEPRL